MTVFLRIIQGLALIYAIWIIARVLYDWGGLLLAIPGVILTPISIVVMPVAMLIFPSQEAAAWALWPAVIVMAVIQERIGKLRRPK